MVCDLGIKSFLKLLAAHTSLFIILFILLAEKQIIDTIMHSCIKHACHNLKWDDLASEAFFTSMQQPNRHFCPILCYIVVSSL